MKSLGLCNKSIDWIKGYVESSMISILVNGSPTEEFKPTNGLKQGDPLALFLFLIVADGLSGLVRQVLRKNLLEGIKVGKDKVEITVLQFADNTLFTCPTTMENILTLKAILRGFELALGLKVNFFKSKLGAIGINDSELDGFTMVLNCSTMKLPFTYLGMPLGGNPRKEST